MTEKTKRLSRRAALQGAAAIGATGSAAIAALKSDWANREIRNADGTPTNGVEPFDINSHHFRDWPMQC